MVLAFIVIVLMVLFLIVDKLRKGIAENDAFYTQMKFMQMYMADKTEQLFFNKSEEESMTLGQDVLFKAGEDFHKLMQYHVIEKNPMSKGDMSLVIAAIQIIKAAEAMVYINKNGPIHVDSD